MGWKEPEKITINIDDHVLVMNIGSLETQYNGNLETIDVAPAIFNEKTFLLLDIFVKS